MINDYVSQFTPLNIDFLTKMKVKRRRRRNTKHNSIVRRRSTKRRRKKNVNCETQTIIYYFRCFSLFCLISCFLKKTHAHRKQADKLKVCLILQCNISLWLKFLNRTAVASQPVELPNMSRVTDWDVTVRLAPSHQNNASIESVCSFAFIFLQKFNIDWLSELEQKKNASVE